MCKFDRNKPTMTEIQLTNVNRVPTVSRKCCSSFKTKLNASTSVNKAKHHRLRIMASNSQKGIAGIIMAAGASRRMEQPKLLLPWRGMPIIRHVAQTALQAGFSPVIAVVGEHSKAIEAALIGLEIPIIQNPYWIEGQSTSVKTGVQALVDLPDDEMHAVVFILGDQPRCAGRSGASYCPDICPNPCSGDCTPYCWQACQPGAVRPVSLFRTAGFERELPAPFKSLAFIRLLLVPWEDGPQVFSWISRHQPTDQKVPSPRAS